ncbi:MAG: hypothetical protein L3J19_03955 [Sulfurimonas sp.]|nr:hypothetical protein [Sulfurimonas sp.]
MICSIIVNEEISFYKKIYKKYYCKNLITTFDNISVKFYVSNFEHAFFESKNRKAKDKSKFSYNRANRIYWIKWILQNKNAELYIGYNSKTKNYDNSRRVAICVDNYAVIISLNRDNNKKAKFITAYLADGVNGKGQKAIDLIKGSPKWIKK